MKFESLPPQKKFEKMKLTFDALRDSNARDVPCENVEINSFYHSTCNLNILEMNDLSHKP